MMRIESRPVLELRFYTTPGQLREIADMLEQCETEWKANDAAGMPPDVIAMNASQHRLLFCLETNEAETSAEDAAAEGGGE